MWGFSVGIFSFAVAVLIPLIYVISRGLECSGQQKLVTVLEFSQYNRSDSLGVKPPLY